MPVEETRIVDQYNVVLYMVRKDLLNLLYDWGFK